MINMLKYLMRNNKADSIKGFLFLIIFALNKPLLSTLILYDISVASRKISINIPFFIVINLAYVCYYYIANYSSEYFLDKFMVNSRNVLNINIYRSILNEDNANLSKYTSVFTNDIPLICENYIHGVISIIYFITSFISASLIIGSINIEMLAYLVIVSVISFIILQRIINALSKKFAEYNDSVAEILKKVNETIPNLKHLKIFNMNDAFLKRFTDLSTDSCNKQFNASFSEDKVEVINQTAATIIEIGMYIISVFLVLNDKMQVGSIVAIVASAEAITLPVYSFSRLLAKFKKTKDVREKVLKLIAFDTSVGINKINKINNIRVENYSSVIEGKQIHQSISFECKQGGKYALIGENGSGKSTLINILTGSDYTYNGEIFFGEKEFKTLNVNSVLSRMSYVSQKIVLFEDTIKNNIILNSEYDDDKYCNIIKTLNLTHLNPDQMITENQDNISGGEKQKIMIARALYKDSDLLLFDEPMSALDSESKVKLLNHLCNIDQRTLMLIIHGENENDLKNFTKVIEFYKNEPQNEPQEI